MHADAPADQPSILQYLKHNAPIPGRFLYSGLETVTMWETISGNENEPFYISANSCSSFLHRHCARVPSSFAAIDQIVLLGPGAGRNELLMLAPLHDYFHARNVTLFDVNLVFLAQTFQLFSTSSYGAWNISLVLSDITTESSFYVLSEIAAGPRLFILLGNTFGNADEKNIIKTLLKITKPKDQLVLHVRKLPLRGVSLEPLNTTSRKYADFVPLAQLSVPFDEAHFEYKTETGLSIIEGTRTVVARYRDFTVLNQHFDRATLSIIHFYDPVAFRAYWESFGVFSVKAFYENSVCLLVYLERNSA